MAMAVFYRGDRCFFTPFNHLNDVNPKTHRGGIATYKNRSVLIRLLAYLFGRIVIYTDRLGHRHFLNKGSLKVWLKRHGENPQFRTAEEVRQKALNILKREGKDDGDLRNLPKEQFDYLFNSLNPLNISWEHIRLLSPKQIQENIDRFKDASLDYLTNEQFLGLDLNRLTREQKTHLLKSSRYSFLTDQQVQDHMLFLDLNLLGLKQIQKLDFNALSKEELNALLKRSAEYLSQEQLQKEYARLNKDLLNRLSNQQVEKLIPYIDLRILTQEQIDALFDHSERRSFINLLTKDQIIEFLPCFAHETLECLTTSKLQEIDIKKVIEKGHLEKFLLRLGVIPIASVVQRLSLQQVREGYQYFSADILRTLKKEQIDHLIPELEELKRDQFNALFMVDSEEERRRRIQLLDPAQVCTFLEFLDTSDLSDDQLATLNPFPEGLSDVEKIRLLREIERRARAFFSAAGESPKMRYSSLRFSFLTAMEVLSIPDDAGQLQHIYTEIRKGNLKSLLGLGDLFTGPELISAFNQFIAKVEEDKKYPEPASKIISYLKYSLDRIKKIGLIASFI
jgi:hypothetical protein